MDVEHPLFPGGESPGLVALLGDVHGNTAAVQRAVDRARAHTNLIIQLGDFGLWPGNEGFRYLEHVNESLGRFDMNLVFVPGNHEDWDQFDGWAIHAPSGLKRFRDRIWAFPKSGYRWTWDGKVWSALGGAVSVDQHHRTQGRSWWPQEAVTDADVEQAITGGPIDVLLTHDVPAGVPTIDVNAVSTSGHWPQRVLTDAQATRDRLRQAVDSTEPGRLWHGHWHYRYRDRLVLDPDSSAPRICYVEGLASDSEVWFENVVLADTAGVLVPWPVNAGQPQT